MSTFVDFAPTGTEPFQFQPILNGTQYTALITWNIFGERYYLNLYDLSNNLIVCEALTESGPMLRCALTWADNVATAVCQAPHNVPIADVAYLRISQTDGSTYEGVYLGTAVDEVTLTFDLTTNPDQPVAIAGTLSFDLDLLGGYGIGSLYFHADTQQFEF